MATSTLWKALLPAFVLALAASSARAEDAVYARDGTGSPVSWFVVYKLPMVARSGGSSGGPLAPTPCDCPPPNCSQLPTASLNVSARATGLCYLYADSNNATLRYFRELGYDCLGQGGDDPVSHTLRHLQPKEPTATTEAKYWAIFNDQLNGIAESYSPPSEAAGDDVSPSPQPPKTGKRVCSGGDLFSAHAKGAVAFDGSGGGGGGGFYLQASTPNFPDPSTVDAARSDKFVPLGCQKDNNLQFAQHFVGMSVAMKQLNALGKQLQAARLCSGNFYCDLRGALASASLLNDGAKPERNTNFSELYKALLDASVEYVDASPTSTLQLRGVPAARTSKSKVFVGGERGESLLSLVKTDTEKPRDSMRNISVTVKTPRAAVPPWALLAETLQSDLSVASWWDGSYGIPNICAGDVYTNATDRFCLDDAGHGVQLNANGSAKFNVENLIEAMWLLPNATEKLRWHLVGGSHQDGNHAKWGVSTPRYEASSSSSEDQAKIVAFADLNMEGFPCSTSCRGSQAGRGGSFFAFDEPRLHASFVDSLIAKACPCVPPFGRSDDESFEALRMCRMGCWRKVQKNFETAELPVMTSEAASFWSTKPLY